MRKINIVFERIKQSPFDLATKFHGFLMERLDTDYVDWLHQQATNPYAMSLIHRDEETIWTITLLTDEAKEQILPRLVELNKVTLLKHGDFPIKRILMEDLSEEDLLQLFNQTDNAVYFTLYFETPTGFKSQGEYVIFPTARLIFQSLIQKYNRLIEGRDEIEEDTLDYLAEHSQITNYRLESSYFKVHGRAISSFKGRLTLKIKGADTLRAYAHMLLRFGEYSGVGMKTSLGMGGFRLETRKN